MPVGAVREGASYLFELRDCDKALAAELLIDDVPADALRSRDPRVARWRWQPGFHAGMVEAVLQVPGTGTQRFEITTDPDLRKLTRDDFDAMVREVLEDTFALFSLTPFRKGIAHHVVNNQPPQLARLEFLRSRADAIVDAVEAIARAPRHFLQSEERTVPLHRANRITGPEIIKSFRSGVIRSEAVKPSRLPSALQGRLPAQITLRQCRSSVDIPEHRQIKGCLGYWGETLNRIADMLGKLGSKHGPEVDSREEREAVIAAERWAIRARHIGRSLNDAAGTGFMAEVSNGPSMLRISSLFRNDPVYQRFYRLWQDMNLGLANLFGDFLNMPLARTDQLYELWCFLRLLRAAMEEYGPKSVDPSALFRNEGSGGVTIAAGAVTVPIGGDWVLCFQRNYCEYWCADDGVGSFSRSMKPDVVLAGTFPGASERIVIVLDAKYRIDQNLKDALKSIHTYRDALVQEAEGSRVEGIVTAAYLLTPHVPTLKENFKETPVPGRLFHPQYREKFRFGAVTLRPRMRDEELRACLRTIVADAEAGV